MGKSDLKRLYEALALPDDALPAEKRRRGTRFEDFLGALLREERLAPRIRYRPAGEEVDGSFEVDGRTYLLEAKWQADQLPASSVYTFKAKVDGKLVGTIGVFVSMSGYSKDAVDALTVGKVLNVILFDKADVEASIEHGVARVMRAKLRAAAEEGVVFFPFSSTVASVSAARDVELSVVPNDDAVEPKSAAEVVIICEGPDDERIVAVLARRVLEAHALSAHVRTTVSHGIQGVPRLANALYPLTGGSGRVIAVVDAEDTEEAVRKTIFDAVEVPLDLIVVFPQVEAWLYPESLTPKAAAQDAARQRGEKYWEHLERESERRDLGELERTPPFLAFRNAIIAAAATPTPAEN